MVPASAARRHCRPLSVAACCAHLLMLLTVLFLIPSAVELFLAGPTLTYRLVLALAPKEHSPSGAITLYEMANARERRRLMQGK